MRAGRIGAALGLFATLLMIPLKSDANPAARSVPVADLRPVSYQPDNATTSQIRVVKMNDDEPMYQPNSIHIVAGQTVEWQNSGQVSHSVTDDPARANKPEDALIPGGVKPFNSGNVMPGASFRHTFGRPGRYRYFCLTHESDKMVGEIIVDPQVPPQPERIAKSEPKAEPGNSPSENDNGTGAPVQVVRMNDDEPMYQPGSIQITVGQTVEWENDGQVSHSVTDDPGRAAHPVDALRPAGASPFYSGSVMPGGKFRHTFNKPGRYRYFCLAHEDDRMVGEVIVNSLEPAHAAAEPSNPSGHRSRGWSNSSDFSPDYSWGPR